VDHKERVLRETDERKGFKADQLSKTGVVGGTITDWGGRLDSRLEIEETVKGRQGTCSTFMVETLSAKENLG